MHHCFSRAINYDEKDPFLCNACGFCKYAKFDFSLTAKPCCAVDPIEGDDDRKKVRHTQMTIDLHVHADRITVKPALKGSYDERPPSAFSTLSQNILW